MLDIELNAFDLPQQKLGHSSTSGKAKFETTK